jgi:integral membrane protein
MLSTPVGRLRLIAFVEGVSALLLFFVAMPIKYVPALGGDPRPVLYVGWVHGILFVLFAVAGFLALFARGWGPMPAVWGFVAAVLPGGTFVYDHLFLRHEHRRERADRASGKDFATQSSHGN